MYEKIITPTDEGLSVHIVDKELSALGGADTVLILDMRTGYSLASAIADSIIERYPQQEMTTEEMLDMVEWLTLIMGLKITGVYAR